MSFAPPNLLSVKKSAARKAPSPRKKTSKRKVTPSAVFETEDVAERTMRLLGPFYVVENVLKESPVIMKEALILAASAAGRPLVLLTTYRRLLTTMPLTRTFDFFKAFAAYQNRAPGSARVLFWDAQLPNFLETYAEKNAAFLKEAADFTARRKIDPFSPAPRRKQRTTSFMPKKIGKRRGVSFGRDYRSAEFYRNFGDLKTTFGQPVKAALVYRGGLDKFVVDEAGKTWYYASATWYRNSKQRSFVEGTVAYVLADGSIVRETRDVYDAFMNESAVERARFDETAAVSLLKLYTTASHDYLEKAVRKGVRGLNESDAVDAVVLAATYLAPVFTGDVKTSHRRRVDHERYKPGFLLKIDKTQAFAEAYHGQDDEICDKLDALLTVRERETRQDYARLLRSFVTREPGRRGEAARLPPQNVFPPLPITSDTFVVKTNGERVAVVWDAVKADDEFFKTLSPRDRRLIKNTLPPKMMTPETIPNPPEPFNVAFKEQDASFRLMERLKRFLIDLERETICAYCEKIVDEDEAFKTIIKGRNLYFCDDMCFAAL